MRKPAEFETHPVSFADAMRLRMFRGIVKRVIDGDTVTVMIDVGFFTYIFADVRIADINTPEIVGAERAKGLEARAFVEGLLSDRPVLLQTHLQSTGTERMSFERYVADIWLSGYTGPTGETNVAAEVRAAGYDKLHPWQGEDGG